MVQETKVNPKYINKGILYKMVAHVSVCPGCGFFVKRGTICKICKCPIPENEEDFQKLKEKVKKDKEEYDRNHRSYKVDN